MKGARMLVLFVAAGIVGCASAGNSLSATDSNVISQEEIVIRCQEIQRV